MTEGINNSGNPAERLPASFIGGLLWHYVAPEATFIYGAIMAFLAVVLLTIVFPKIRENTAEKVILNNS